MNESFYLTPPSAASADPSIDLLFLCLLLLCLALALGVAWLILYFSIKYRYRAHADRSAAPTRGRTVEFLWTLLPLLIFLALYAWGSILFAGFYRPPPDALPVFVVAKQWMWKLQHGNGRREIDELHLPLGQGVKLVMTSQDVIHSFFIPAFRIKQDVVPGRYTSVWFRPTRLGEFHLFCSEFCGTDHAAMRGRIVVQNPDEYARWLAAGPAEPTLAARGFTLFRRYGCSGCHDPRSTVHAPSLVGLFGRPVHLADGRTLIADENYLRDCILDPSKNLVAGYAQIMPHFQGQLAEEDIAALVEYIRQWKE
jgi:cytochrome c oxidase subunit 2